MMMMDICTDGNVQDMEMEKLKEKYFKSLLEQLKINEKNQEDQDSLLLEMYLAYIYSKQSVILKNSSKLPLMKQINDLN